MLATLLESVPGGCCVERNRADSAARKPVIGLAAGVAASETRRRKLLMYVGAIEKAGGEPRRLPLSTDGEVLSKAMSDVDALLITGGRDIHPRMYGEDIDSAVELETQERVDRDAACMELAKKSGMPVLAICYGMQILNVVEGGTLYQDMGSEIVPFHRASGKDYVEHDVVIEPGTFLERIVGSQRITVRSSHHQAVKKLGAGLVVSARCARGEIIEAVEREGSFFLGVQWHPERHERQPDRIFVAFVGAASSWARQRSK
jgi:putative glutamine amidotransferase